MLTASQSDQQLMVMLLQAQKSSNANSITIEFKNLCAIKSQTSNSFNSLEGATDLEPGKQLILR